MAIATLIINFILLYVVGDKAKVIILEKEETYLAEIVSNISNNISATMLEYSAIADMLAINTTVVSLLEQSTATSPMHNNSQASVAIAQMYGVTQKYSNVLNVALMDIQQDGYLLHDGSASDSSFSFQSRSYYSVVTTRQSMITQPYLDVASGGLVVSVVSPVLSATGVALGAVVVDLSLDFVSDLVLVNHFGDTGNSIILDGSGMIMGHEDKSNVGKDVSVLNLSGTQLETQLKNPTNSPVEFNMNGVSRNGEVGSIGDTGWILITSLDNVEFQIEAMLLLRVLLVMLILSAVVTFWIVLFTVKFCLKPLTYVEEAMSQLSAGHLHYKLDYQGDNEIGTLAEHFRETIQKLATYIDEIQRLLSAYGQGDFTVNTNMQFQGDFSNIQHAMEDFSKLISSALEGIKATVDQVSIGSDYVATGSQSLAEGSMTQSDSVQQLNTHISEIAEKVTNNLETVRYVNKTSKEMEAGLSEGNKQMEQMVLSMEEISRRSEGIQKIIRTIEDVAFQTNILALNAAVEAARAGSAGRGFAVVAEEVRNLSNRTSVAVSETTVLIEETVSAVREGSEIVDGTSKELNFVNEKLNEFIGSLQDITEASEEQATAIQLIHNDVNEITRVMQTNSAVSEESAATSEELSSQAAVMKDTIQMFKTAEARKSGFGTETE